MEIKDIKSSNKLIAEFMEATSYKHGIFDAVNFPEKTEEGFKSYDLIYLKYNSSWDWLMPCIDKIERLYETETSLPMFEINSHYCKFALTYPHKYKVFIAGCYRSSPEEIKANSKIEAAWMVAVEFIKYYNKQNNK